MQKLKWVDALLIVVFKVRSPLNMTVNEILSSRQMSVHLPLQDHQKQQPYSFSSDISDYVKQLNNTVMSISTGDKIIPQKENRSDHPWKWVTGIQMVICKGVRSVQGRRSSITTV